jgi:hypothetical protein
MSEEEARGELRAFVSHHTASMSRGAQRRLATTLDEAAARFSNQPERADEARENIVRFLNRATSLSGGGATFREIDEVGVEMALRDLCPIWPIC